MSARADRWKDTSPEPYYSWDAAPAPLDPAPAKEFMFFDETLRDGIQTPAVDHPTFEQKREIVDHMVAVGIRSADLGFPGAGAEAAADCTAIAQHIVDHRYPLARGFAGRTHEADITAIAEIAQSTGAPVEAYVFIGVSPIRQYVEGWGVDTVLQSIRDAARQCEREGIEFVLVLEDATRCTPQMLIRIYETAIEFGVRRLTLCDTVGASMPSGTRALVAWSRRFFADRQQSVDIEWHGHNDRGLAVVNALTALAAGCTRLHGTILGVGERAGNAAIDQMIVNCELNAQGEFDLVALRKYCDYASNVLDIEIPGNYPAMGSDVFTTSAGIHAAAILKAHLKQDDLLKDRVYSSVPASFLGREQRVVIDASSGASTVHYWFATRGLEADDATVREILRAAKGSRKPLDDGDVLSMALTAQHQAA